ncbi:hypothetical protein GCM10020218_063160 [Dactylosporangium vinaceum]|uniref:Uncharacterized protein n=1 Tax=Dactylosporangium vinaceum TaxID=53362 RepID=A0ABV5M9U7_9ACTN|nr:hypothetical protein [Dactylosporangium vinaceum]
MSYDLAVWEGDRPAGDAAAAAEFERLYHRYIEPDEVVPPTPAIAAFVQALLGRYPDRGTHGGGDSPWSAGPLLKDAAGPVIYFPIVWQRCEEVADQAAQLAEEHGLHCFDPQQNQLRTRPGVNWQFELTSARGHRFRDPDPEVVRQVLIRLSRDDYYAVLTRADGWYVQAGYGQQAAVRPGWYALERQDGAPDRHFRTETSDIAEVVRTFVGFLHGDPTLTARFAWRPYAP